MERNGWNGNIMERRITDRRAMGGGAGSAVWWPAAAAAGGWSSSQERWRGVRTERRRAGPTVLGRRDSSGVLLPPPFNCRKGSVVTTLTNYDNSARIPPVRLFFTHNSLFLSEFLTAS